MISSFKCKETERIWYGELAKKLPNQIQQTARRKLRMLNSANDLNDLRVPPNNRLEALQGDLKGMYSIRINHQWRICFRWSNGVASEVMIVDYH